MYTTDSEYFAIHENTGIIYPKERTFDTDNDDSTTFIVTATDRYGEGLSGSLIVEVK